MFNVKFKCSVVLPILIVIGGTTVSSLDTKWWKNTILYEIYIASFKDSNGDGIGDIKGITQNLDHFDDIGVKTLHISPFLESPMADLGYDVSNFTDIDPLFGTMADFDELIHEMKRRGLKLIMDFVVNHSSDEHPWFQKSIDKVDPYTDYYVWADPKGFDQNKKPIPPNNWMSVFDGSAWEWNEKRRQFYLHQFAIKQPDFNLRNIQVINEIKKLLKFWMDRGVSGFRLDATRHYIEDESLRDEPLRTGKTNFMAWNDLNHLYTTDLWESYEVIHQFREYTDKYSRSAGYAHETLIIAEAYVSLNLTMAYYGTKDYPIAHFPYIFAFVLQNTYQNASGLNDLLTDWMKNIPKGGIPNWMAENHDNVRIGTRLGEEYMDIIITTIMMLPGVACIYYGQEIGMTNGKIRSDQRRDPNNNGFGPDSYRDGQRLPMQWDNTLNAGYTSNMKPWLPVHPNYWRVNVETQKKGKVTHYNMFKALSKIRTRKTMKLGSYKPYIVSDWVFAFVRSLRGHEKYITVLNLGSEIELVDLHDNIPYLPRTLEVVAASINAGYEIGDQIPTGTYFPKVFLMRPLSAIVFSTKVHRSRSSKFEKQSLEAVET